MVGKRLSKSFLSIFNGLYPDLSPSDGEKALKYFLFTLKKFPDKFNILQLKLFLYVFSFTIRKLFIKDKNIKSFFNYLQKSNFVIFRKLGVYTFVLFGHCVSRSLDGEGVVYSKLNYPSHPNATVEKKSHKLPDKVQVAVIGSGAGGGIAANTLAKKYDVAVFDKASYLNKETNNETFGYHNYFEHYGLSATRGFGIQLLTGKSVGGGTSINWQTSLETPKQVLNEWDQLTSQDNYFDSDMFRESIKYVTDNLDVNTEYNNIPLKEEKLAEGFDKNNINYRVIPKNNSSNHGMECGFCAFGCGYVSRNSSYKVWLNNEDFDGNIYSDTSIKRMILNNNEATHIEVENNGVISIVEVEKVILAGGSLNTPSILLNSGYKNPQLGKNLKTHPVSGVAGRFKEEQKPWFGSMQGMHSEDFLFKTDNYGYLLQGLPMHPSIFFPYFPNFVSSAADFIESYNNWSGAIVLTSDTSSGSLINNGPLWKYRLNDFDSNHLLDGLTKLVKSYYLAGAEEIMVSASPTMYWKRNESQGIEEFINQIISIKNQPYRLLLGSAHQMGTARMNPNPNLGVTDLNGKVHGLDNVYIVDSSIFPRCSGVNPMVTIQSTSHFLMSQL